MHGVNREVEVVKTTPPLNFAEVVVTPEKITLREPPFDLSTFAVKYYVVGHAVEPHTIQFSVRPRTGFAAKVKVTDYNIEFGDSSIHFQPTCLADGVQLPVEFQYDGYDVRVTFPPYTSTLEYDQLVAPAAISLLQVAKQFLCVAYIGTYC